ncbi:MAG: hypothetical protein U5N27_18640 [Rhizobium sp.]|nr:hypothetical protein [Rhizobium sp.]
MATKSKKKTDQARSPLPDLDILEAQLKRLAATLSEIKGKALPDQGGEAEEGCRDVSKACLLSALDFSRAFRKMSSMSSRPDEISTQSALENMVLYQSTGKSRRLASS